MKEQLKKILKEINFPPMKDPETYHEEEPIVIPTEEPTIPMKDIPWEKPSEETHPVKD